MQKRLTRRTAVDLEVFPLLSSPVPVAAVALLAGLAARVLRRGVPGIHSGIWRAAAGHGVPGVATAAVAAVVWTTPVETWAPATAGVLGLAVILAPFTNGVRVRSRPRTRTPREPPRPPPGRGERDGSPRRDRSRRVRAVGGNGRRDRRPSGAGRRTSPRVAPPGGAIVDPAAFRCPPHPEAPANSRARAVRRSGIVTAHPQ